MCFRDSSWSQDSLRQNVNVTQKELSRFTQLSASYLIEIALVPAWQTYAQPKGKKKKKQLASVITDIKPALRL